MAPESAVLTGRITPMANLTSRISSVSISKDVDFLNIIQEMKLHYKSPQKRYSLYPMSVSLASSYLKLNRYNFTLVTEEQKSLQRIKDHCNDNLKKVVFVMENTVRVGFEELQQTRNTEDFKRKMEEGRRQAKEESNQAIDSYYDTVIQEGEKNPGLQPVLIQTSQDFSSCVNNIMLSIRSFLENIIREIVAWVEEAWEKVKAAWEDVKKFVSDCYNEVADFVSSLF